MQRVLVIDDDVVSRKTVSKYLGDTCKTEFAFDGEEGLIKATELVPDIIFLDVEMPGMNGYVVCEQPKQNDITQHIPVIFLSGRQSAREKLLGYEAGADDYLVKPFEPKILLGNHNEDCAQLSIRPTNQSLAPCIHTEDTDSGVY